MTPRRGLDPLRLGEAAAEALLVLGAVVLPAAWRALDAELSAVLIGMSLLLTAGVYALHAVTFDCFRMTGHREIRVLSYTQREE